MADIVIRNGLIVDGTGSEPRPGSVEVTDGIITAVGDVDGSAVRSGARVLDAEGALITPGFIDIHTHFDGQVTWDPIVAPSSLHGITTIAMGNCGVGFAPAAPDKREWLISLLEGVEDIPGTALAEGLTWDWETFPEYLDSLEAKPHTVDLAAHLPHAALRTYVMGERGADHTEMPSEAELAEMSRQVKEALAAGAVGFATSRTDVHRTSAGEFIPTLTASDVELLAIANAMNEAGTGVVQLISDLYQTTDDEFAQSELDLLEKFVRVSGRPLSFTMQQAYHSSERWRFQMDWVDRMVASGLDVRAQVATRPIGVLLGLQATASPFAFCASYGELAFHELPDRVAALRDPERRRRILAEHREVAPTLEPGILQQVMCGFDVMFEMSDPVDYEMDKEWSIASRAAAAGADPLEMAYDMHLEDDGKKLLYLPLFNFAHGNFDDIHSMMTSPNTLFGLSDGGAHCGTICDASVTTSSMTVWSRDRRKGDLIPIESIVHGHTQRNARYMNWLDRGVVAPGYIADLNVIDLDTLACRTPTIVHDLPAGGRRLMQTAEGYRWTIKSGQVTFENGEHSGELPGTLLRGGRPGVVT
ncbi:MAG TPA: amidohydrolase family protein [Microthrixaceae bacterium]|nr:amidohydrolase family protein [Microthrixaceae bacterium]